MTVTKPAGRPPWLLLVFSLPAGSASARVAVWRKIRRYGMLPLRSSGYVLPADARNQERAEWLAAAIRAARGHATLVRAQSLDNYTDQDLRGMFTAARARPYQALAQEVSRLLKLPPARRNPAQLNRMRKRFQGIVEIDFFPGPERARAEKLLELAQEAGDGAVPRRGTRDKGYRKKVWITRPRPGIDRVSSAWLIRRFIDPAARFVFGAAPVDHPDAIPFDMFGPKGFGHRGEDCTFETLARHFAIRQRGVRAIAEMVHDADLADQKFGRMEAMGIDEVLRGWEAQGVPDEELLRRGMEIFEGLYTAYE